jgi:hypothetical protein
MVHTLEEFTPLASSQWKSKFVAQTLKKNGRRLPSYIRAKNRVVELFYRVPSSVRSLRIPAWFSTHLNAPSYAFRIAGKSMSVKQKAVSTAMRLYYMYRFHVVRGSRHCNLLTKISRWDSLFYLLYGAFRCRNWVARVTLATRKLKVLLCPILGLA